MAKYRRNIHWNEIITNKEEIRLVWLDSNINDTDDSIQMQTALLKLNSAAQFYTDYDRCMDMIKSVRDEQILFVVSSELVENIFPQICHFRSIVDIFIMCTNDEQQQIQINEYKQWTKQFVTQDSLLRSISQCINQHEKQRIAFSLFDKKQKSLRNLSKGNTGSYLWHQVLLYVLKQMPQDEQSKEDMLNVCRDYYQFDDKQLKVIEEFRKNYNSDEALRWYTKESFVYKLVNRALRTEDIDLLYLFRFFITDLCSNIENEKMINNDNLTLYRGQIISNEELELLKHNTEHIISINGFFSTSRNREVARFFIDSLVASDDYSPIIFEICVDSKVQTVAFADVSHQSLIPDEQEVLFAPNVLLKIEAVDFDLEQQIWNIKLITTDEGMELINSYMTFVQQEIDFYSPMICFGRLLLHELGEIDRAEKYFNILSKSHASDYLTMASIHNWLGVVYHKRNQLSLALEKYQLAYNIRQDNLSIDHPHQGQSYFDFGIIAEGKKDYVEALNYYEKALDLYDRSYNNDFTHKAELIKKIGIVYRKKGDPITALQYLSRALSMFEYTLPAQHPYIGMCLREMGLVYLAQNDFDKALTYFLQKLEIDEQSLPAKHPYHYGDIDCIVKVYKMKHEIDMALSFCQQKLADYRNDLGTNHSRTFQILLIMAELVEHKDHHMAFQYHMEALSILQQAASVDHRTVADCLSLINCLRFKHYTNENRLRCFMEILNLYRRILPSDDVNIANICRKIASCYQEMKTPWKAVVYLDESLRIYQTRYGSEHNIVKLVKSNHEKVIKIQQKPFALHQSQKSKCKDNRTR